MVTTKDGSNTLFSSKYNQTFHDEKTGAYQESLIKHIEPAFSYFKEKKHLRILDICFGIGYNTFATIDYLLRNDLDMTLEIFSPEFDEKLVRSLDQFAFPDEFEHIKPIIDSIANNLEYQDKKIKIEVSIGDAREYIKGLNYIDVIYQDAFSSEVNHELWTVEYFKDIKALCAKDAIMTSYSISTPVRLSMYEAGFEIYEIKPMPNRRQTLALTQNREFGAKYIDMELKKTRNKEAKALYDK